jgi:hypothetical protein
LDKMIEQEAMAFNDKEPFEFYLSAFLNAGRTVDYRLRHEEATYPTWREGWDETLTPEHQPRLSNGLPQRDSRSESRPDIRHPRTCGQATRLIASATGKDKKGSMPPLVQKTTSGQVVTDCCRIRAWPPARQCAPSRPRSPRARCGPFP